VSDNIFVYVINELNIKAKRDGKSQGEQLKYTCLLVYMVTG